MGKIFCMLVKFIQKSGYTMEEMRRRSRNDKFFSTWYDQFIFQQITVDMESPTLMDHFLGFA